MKRIALATSFSLLALSASLAAHAVEYKQVQTAKSNIHFTYKQMGVAVDGKFKRFSSQLSFDPARPTAAKASFDVELASVDTGAPEGDEEVAGKPWFNTKAFPTARFVSSSVKALGGNRYAIHFEELADFSDPEFSRREDALDMAMTRYAALLDRYCRQAPLNWFNFYDFWAAEKSR